MDNLKGMPVGNAFAFQNNREGFERLLGSMARAQKATGATKIVVAMEPTGHYWKPLAWYLRKAGITVVLVNPYHVKRYKEFDDNSPSKNDRKDAWVIARLANEASFFEVYLPEGVYAELRGLTQARQQQRNKCNMALNQIQCLLDEYFPEYEEVFADILGRASLYVLEHRPFPQDILAVSAEELAEELKRASNRRVGLKRALRLQEAARDSIGVTEGLEAARLRLKQLLEEARFWRARLAETESAMADALQRTGLAKYLLSVPGVGVVLAASFLGEIGDPGRYQDSRQIRKLAGLNLVEDSSGQKKGRSEISKRGRPGLRSVLYQMAMTMASKNVQFRALYRHFISRSENPLKPKQALIALGCKLVRVLWTLMREKRLWDPDRVLGTWRTEQLALAA
jgi:transposase